MILKTFRNAVILFMLFMVGTMAVVHVDRQCAMMEEILILLQKVLQKN